MTPYDFIMAGLLLAGLVWGAIRGITWQLASIASLALGYAVAYPASAGLVPYIHAEPVVARGVSMLLVYAGVSGGVFLVAWSIRATLKAMKFEAFDRHLGMVLGGLEGALLGLVGTVIAASISPPARQVIMTSPSGKVVGAVLNAAQPALPGELRDVLAKYWDPKTDDAPLAEATKADAPPAPAEPDPKAPATTAADLVRTTIDREEARVGRNVVDALEGRIGRAVGDDRDAAAPRR